MEQQQLFLFFCWWCKILGVLLRNQGRRRKTSFIIINIIANSIFTVQRIKIKDVGHNVAKRQQKNGSWNLKNGIQVIRISIFFMTGLKKRKNSIGFVELKIYKIV